MSMTDVRWHEIQPPSSGVAPVPGLPGVRLDTAPVFHDARGSLHELYRLDEIPPEFKPVMACASWSLPGVSRGPHQHVQQDDYFTFAGPSDFLVVLWDARPGAAGPRQGWRVKTGQSRPLHISVPDGVIHGYRNTGSVPGLVITVTSALFRGPGRKESIDEIRHELDPNSPYRFPES